MMIDVDPSFKKKKGAAFFELDEDITLEWLKEHQAFLLEEQRQKIQKKFEKENEKLATDGQKEMKASELEERLKVVKETEKKYNKENKTGKVEAEGRAPTIDRLETSITKLEQRIETMSVQAQDKEDNKEVALGTSKIVSIITCCVLSLLIEEKLTRLPELHRSSSHRCFLQEIQRPNREVLLQGSSGEVCMGHQVCGRRLGVLIRSRILKVIICAMRLDLYIVAYHLYSFSRFFFFPIYFLVAADCFFFFIL